MNFIPDTGEIADEIEKSEDVGAGADEAESNEEDINQQISSLPFRVIYQTSNFFLPQISNLIEDGDNLNLRPEYQRRLRWSNKQKSLLVESLLLNVPIPPVFLYENDLARYEVMDGQQRLNTIKEFMKNEFSLRGLQIISSLNGKSYHRLPGNVKRSLDRASISAIVLLQESQGRIKSGAKNRVLELRRFVFERLNTGGKRLSAQEIRNAIFDSEFNKMIVRLSRNDIFTRIWGIPPYVGADPSEYYEDELRQKNSLYKTMGDCQLVLRYFALSNEDHIQGQLRSMLDRCMEWHHEHSADECQILQNEYIHVLSLADEVFNGKPFSLPNSDEYRPSAGIYDGVMIALSKLTSDQADRLKQRRSEMLERYKEMTANQPRGALTGVASTADDIKRRIKFFRDLFNEFH